MTNDPGAFQPIALPRPSQVVAAELRQRILRGEWREGAPLPPASVLAKRLGISRHHVDAPRYVTGQALVVTAVQYLYPRPGLPREGPVQSLSFKR